MITYRKFYHVLFLCIFSLLLCLGIPRSYAQDVQVVTNADQERLFEEALSETIARLDNLLTHEPSRLRAINDSIENTIKAAKLMYQQRNPVQALKLLKSAQKSYSDNVIAYLLAGEAYVMSGNISKANHERVEFLKKASRAPWIARKTMSWENRKIISEYVASQLKASGVTPPKVTGLQQIPMIQKLVWEDTNLLREVIVVGLPILVCAGFLFYLWKIMTGSDIMIGTANRMTLEFYLLIVGLYILWILHLFANIPRIMDPPELEILTFLVLGTILILSVHGYEIFINRYKELHDPMLRKCPKCKAMIGRITSECPHCKHKE